MAELKRIEEEFPMAEVARDGNPPKQPERLKDRTLLTPICNQRRICPQKIYV
jgi:hypothetical protein